MSHAANRTSEQRAAGTLACCEPGKLSGALDSRVYPLT